MEIGQTVYLEPIRNQARKSKEIVEGQISKIGKKYFEVKQGKYATIKCHLSSMEEVSNISPNWKVHLSKQAILDMREKEHLLGEFHSLFVPFGRAKNFSLEQLRQIKEIVGE